MGTKSIQDDIRKIKPLLQGLEKSWDAKKSIIYMKESGCTNWRQMEWIGFYFQYRCEQLLGKIMRFQEPKYGNCSFDGFLEFPWDFKAHPTNDGPGSLITNDSDASAMAIADYGAIGLILASGLVTYNDLDRTFKKWHDMYKGGISKYEKERISRGAPSRLRKTHFELSKIEFIKIADNTLLRSGSFQEGFRNSDGSPRKPKVLLDLTNLPSNEIVDVITF